MPKVPRCNDRKRTLNIVRSGLTAGGAAKRIGGATGRNVGTEAA